MAGICFPWGHRSQENVERPRLRGLPTLRAVAPPQLRRGIHPRRDEA